MVDSTTMELDKNVAALQCRVESLLERQRSDASGRILVALAGVPGSGKTTVSSALLLSLSKRGMSKQDVVVVPMVCVWIDYLTEKRELPQFPFCLLLSLSLVDCSRS